MQYKFFSVVIPVIPKHFKYLTKLLSELAVESDYIREILICASSINSSNLETLNKIVRNSPTQPIITVLSSARNRTAGENRNVGWDESKSEYVAFLDADDMYHPMRFSIIFQVLVKHNADALVHDYYRMAPQIMFARSSVSSFVLANTEVLRLSNESRMENQLPQSGIYFGETNLELPDDLKAKSRVHHGHLVAKKDLPMRYTSRRIGEDGELIVEILKSGFNLVYINSKLSIYDRLNFANLKDLVLGQITVKLSKSYRFFFKPKLRR